MVSIIDLFEESVRKYGDAPYLWEKKTDKFEPTSYNQTKKLVYDFAAGLQSLGLKEEDRVALLSEGRNDWVLSELAILYSGAISVPLSIKLETEDIKFRLNHSETKFVIVSSSQLRKIQYIVDEIKTVEKIIILDEVESTSEKELLRDDVYRLGNLYLKNHKHEFESRFLAVKPSNIANISYTSGTTADPKGIILTHRNYTANVEQATAIISLPSEYRSLMILPLDHAFAHTCGIYIFMKLGASFGTVQIGKTPLETLKNIKINIQELKPHVLLSVPALARNFRKGIEDGIRQKGKFIDGLFNKALKLGYLYNKEGYNKGVGLKFWIPLQLKIYDLILFRSIRKFFGGNMKFFVGGGALLDIELQRFYYAIGIPMYQGYGLSEASPIISANNPKHHKLGSSGILVKNMDLKICNEDGTELAQGKTGEIVIRGENVMLGYWRNEAATKETIRNNWLYTGDMGYMDADGYLYVVGRSKSLLISNDGEKYSPEQIEETLNENSRYIDQAVLHNNQNPYTIALIVPKRDAIVRFLKQNNYDTNDKKGLTEALKLIQNEIDQYKEGGEKGDMFNERWLPSAIGILDQPFTEQNKFLNSTMKMVRRNVTTHYQDLIDFLYTPKGKLIVNDANIEALRRFLN